MKALNRRTYNKENQNMNSDRDNPRKKSKTHQQHDGKVEKLPQTDQRKKKKQTFSLNPQINSRPIRLLMTERIKHSVRGMTKSVVIRR